MLSQSPWRRGSSHRHDVPDGWSFGCIIPPRIGARLPGSPDASFRLNGQHRPRFHCLGIVHRVFESVRLLSPGRGRDNAVAECDANVIPDRWR